MRLQRERPPNAVHRRDRQARRLGHRARAPVRCGGRHGLQGCRHHLGDLVIADLAWRARARLVEQPTETFAANRLRQVVTVTRVIPSRLAMPRLVMPPAARSTISARRASARKLFRRRARASSSARSAPANSIRIAARPRIPASPKHPAGTGNHSQANLPRNFGDGTLARIAVYNVAMTSPASGPIMVKRSMPITFGLNKRHYQPFCLLDCARPRRRTDRQL